MTMNGARATTRHIGERELSHRFTSVEQLIADFLADVVVQGEVLT